MKKRVKISIRKSDKKIFINIYNKKDGVVVEANDFGLNSNSKYYVKYSSGWFAFRSIFSIAFSLRKRTPEIEINSVNTNIDSFIKKNLEAIFVGLETLGLADRNTFYNRSDMSFHKEESKWLVKEFNKLNREKFTKYLKKHLKNNQM